MGEEEPSTTGVKCCGWFDGTWIIFDGLMSSF